MLTTRIALVSGIVLFFIALGVGLLWSSSSLLHDYVTTGMRLVGVAALIFYAWHKKNLTTTILVSMVIGIEVGIDFPEFSQKLKIVSQIFLRLIKSIIAPLLFGTLVYGIAGHSQIRQVGRMGWKSLLYFEIVTTLALIIGLLAINITKAGAGIQLPSTPADEKLPATRQTITDVILHIFPENIAKSIYEGAVLEIVVFSILFGIATAMISEQHRRPVILFVESLSEVMFKFTSLVMYLAPLAVGCAIAYTVGHMGLGIMVNLVKLLLTLYAALLFFLLVVLLPVALMFKVPLRKFLHAIAEPVSIAFATTSSESALPKAMRAMEQIGVPRKIVAFVMPMGYSFNLDGTTLYLSLATIFVAQASGIQLSWSTQLAVMLTLMLTSKGVAGVPRASLVILLGTLASFGLPVEPVYVILGIDELMDMARTSVNVIGNCLATVVIARWEGEFNEQSA
ncbi:MAG: cation:dicarboxylase symporter family transporter [Chitinophagales bacterium]|nr:cation:dicarboxylase symporter family transporter [Chitinophagales bacterium]MDW8418709.1 cation:dicarboxylase symporter family transporter [Chitinophagales bacterium]